MEGMLVSRVKADETTTDQKPEGLEEYDADERVVDDVKQQQSKQTENMGKCVSPLLGLFKCS